MIGSARKRLLIALLFLLPNLIGFLLFTAGPVIFSLYLSFTDMQLTKHNQFSDESIQFVGIQNYQRLLVGDEAPFFWDYFWNTVFLMIGIPISIAGSLALALMVNAKASPERKSQRRLLTALAAAITVLICIGAWLLNTPDESLKEHMSAETGLTDMTLHEVQTLRRNGIVTFIALVGIIITAGIGVGQMFFRAAFYLPTLLAGVAMFLLWKTLYRPRGGLINATLEPALNALEHAVINTPPLLWYALGTLLALAGIAFLAHSTAIGINKLRHKDTGPASLAARFTLSATLTAVLVALGFVTTQLPTQSLFPSGHAPLTPEQAAATLQQFQADLDGQYDTLELDAAREDILNGGEYRNIRAQLISIAGEDQTDAVTRIVQNNTKPVRVGYTAGEGLAPPEWLVSSDWAKTALVIMGVWLTIGGANMLLYLAGLSNIPPELYEASAIDGATGWQRFIHVTWPQLAPTTFFIVIMSTIAGLQGGFEQALVMTQGNYDTIVLTYYLYNLAFNGNFQLGLASAVAWIMFAIIFAMTAFNFRFGSRMTNE